MEARVRRISIAPVKSLGLVHPDEVMLGPGGVVGDRRFWLQDAEGALFGGKRSGALQQIRPDWDESSRELTLGFPGGMSVAGTVELGAPVAAELYREPRPSHRVIGPWEQAISQFVGKPLTLLWADESAVDRTPEGGTISLVSRGSLEQLRSEGDLTDVIDGRRFRMLFEIDGVGPHEEDDWIGQEVRIGEATARFNGDIGRCVVTSRHPDTGVVDLPTLDILVRYRPEGQTERLPFGVYGAVVVPGRVALGDTVSVVARDLETPALTQGLTG